MAAIADIFMAAGAIGAAVYCIVLARRLRRFTNLEQGVGGAVAVLSAQVDDLTRALSRAEGRAADQAMALAAASDRAEAAAGRLDLLLAALHDLPAPPTPPPTTPPTAAPPDMPAARVFVRQGPRAGAAR